MSRLVIGTRGSPLALWQAREIARRLEIAHPGIETTLQVIRTTGDEILDAPLAKVGGKGLFVKEIEQALLAGTVDLAVHSMKDVPAALPAGLVLAAIDAREDPRDAWVSHRGPLARMPAGARVGTSSLRRQSQLRALRPDLVVEPLRGNVDTRLRKLDEGRYDGVVLAAAGLVRLGHANRITERLPPDLMLPAIAQGALGIETREDDARVRSLVSVLHDAPTARCVEAERALLRRLGGGCQVPIAGLAVLEGTLLRLEALVAWPDGSGVVRGRREGPASAPAELGRELAEELLGRGADRILRELAPGGQEGAA